MTRDDSTCDGDVGPGIPRTSRPAGLAANRGNRSTRFQGPGLPCRCPRAQAWQLQRGPGEQRFVPHIRPAHLSQPKAPPAAPARAAPPKKPPATARNLTIAALAAVVVASGAGLYAAGFLDFGSPPPATDPARHRRCNPTCQSRPPWIRLPRTIRAGRKATDARCRKQPQPAEPPAENQAKPRPIKAGTDTAARRSPRRSSRPPSRRPSRCNRQPKTLRRQLSRIGRPATTETCPAGREACGGASRESPRACGATGRRREPTA